MSGHNIWNYKIQTLSLWPLLLHHHHCALCYLLKSQELGRQLTVWCLELSEFYFEIKYVSGKKHIDADYFSRNLPKGGHKECCEKDFFEVHPHNIPVYTITLYSLNLLRKQIVVNSIFLERWNPTFTASEQRHDPEFIDIIEHLEGIKTVPRRELRKTQF